MVRKVSFAFLPFLLLGAHGPARADDAGGSLKGTVTLAANNLPVHKARILIPQLSRTAETNEDGVFEFKDIPPGSYEVIARAPALADERRTVEITAGGTAKLDFQLSLAAVREQITVTASGREQTALEAFQSVNVVDTIELVEKPQTSLGAVLDGTPGVAKRSFGPGSSRPVIRGFDGDRVLIMKDGVSTGSLSSQSGDHGESIDVLGLERLEVVKGPATLLYGASAIGGVVNAVTSMGDLHDHPHAGLDGYFSAVGGSANALGGGGAGFEYGIGDWAIWANGAGNRTGSYDTPIGTVPNSAARTANANGGFGRYSPKAFFNVGFGYEDGRFGVPPLEDEIVQLATRRYNTRFNGGLRNLTGWVESMRLTLDYSDYQHKELEIEPDGSETLGTLFKNNLFSYRGVFDQKRTGRFSGQFGFSGLARDYKTTGAEAIAPPTDQTNFAFFTLQEVDLKHLRLQFGGRVDRTAYDPTGLFPNRTFTGFSGAAGIHVPVWKGGAVVANFTHSFRSPALEELYNNGPHPGNASFEIGNPFLTRERSDGLDLSIRHHASRLRAEANFYYYFIHDFVFLAPTGRIVEGLIEAEYLQGNSRFLGGEATLDVGLRENLWLNFGLDIVNAELKSSVTTLTTGNVISAGTPLPRIPPLRGRVGFECRFKGLSLRPEAVLASDQDSLFLTETRTAGYAVFNFNASYTIARQHSVHVFSLNAFNLGDRLYRNHLSFIKSVAPEIGRGVRFSYTVRFL